MSPPRSWKILYAYEADAADLNVQSGRPHAILQELLRRGIEVIPAFPLRQRSKWLVLPQVVRARLSGKVYRRERHPAALARIAQQVEARARQTRPDFIFAPGSVTLTKVRAEAPLIFCSDATFDGMIDFYPQFTGLDPGYVLQAHRQEAEALARCAAAIYSSAWAADSAVRRYGADPARVHVVPFGANVEPPPREAVLRHIAGRPADRLDLLFLGREWARKGGGMAVEVTAALRDMGIAATLHVVGPREAPEGLPDWVRFHGFLNRAVPAEAARMASLLENAHFLLSLATAEAAARAVCDGFAHGVPALTLAVGGMRSTVEDGVNGQCFEAGTSAAAVAAFLAPFAGSPTGRAAYAALATRARDSYETTFNWRAFVDALLAIAERVR